MWPWSGRFTEFTPLTIHSGEMNHVQSVESITDYSREHTETETDTEIETERKKMQIESERKKAG